MFRSLRTWFLLAFVVPSLLLFAVAGTVAYLVTRRILENELGDSLSRVAASAAAQINADRLLTVEPQDDLDQTRTWRNLLRDLDGVRQAAGARRVFAADASGRMRIDAGGALPVGAQIPELERDRAELGWVQKGGRAASQVLFAGADGRLYKTGYAPIRQGEQVVAFVGVEGTSDFFDPLRWLFEGYLALVGLALAVLGGVALWTERAVSRPLARLMESALRIGAGDLSTPVEPEPVREIGVLAAELEAMRQALEGRDRQLKMMLAGVAHEVRNPIGGVELFAGLLAEELGKEGEAASHVARIQGELQYLKRIVEDFLTFAREQKLATAPLDAAGLLGSARDLMEGDAAKKRVKVR